MPEEPQPKDVIVVGGGVAGLACARCLAEKGRRVLLLEARPRLGGRIESRRVAGLGEAVELGAEFIHGGNADLWRLVARSGARARKVKEIHSLFRDGRIHEIPDLDRAVASVTGLIAPRKAGNLSFAAYFKRYRPAVDPEAWELACGFAEGFETGPLGEISARSLAGESLDERRQYRLPDGYGRIVACLAEECRKLGVDIRTGSVVRTVRWGRGAVRIATFGPGKRIPATFVARAAVLTVAVGVLQAARGPGAIRFVPDLGRKRACIRRMRMGDVARMVFHFRPRQWRRLVSGMRGAGRSGFGFLHAPGERVPVWWSLTGRPVVVGWAGGPAATRLLGATQRRRREIALGSLGNILGVAASELRRSLLHWEHRNWTADPFARGAYSFTAAGGDDAAGELAKPLLATLFFAGEATAQGGEVGTVHGALASGIRAAGEVTRAARRAKIRRI